MMLVNAFQFSLSVADATTANMNNSSPASDTEEVYSNNKERDFGVEQLRIFPVHILFEATLAGRLYL